eukprot:gene9377-11734_t
MVISLNQVHKSTSFVEMHSLCALLVSSALVVVGSTSAAPPRISLVGKVEVPQQWTDLSSFLVNTKVMLNSGEQHIAHLRADGTFIFSDLATASYTLHVHSPFFEYDPLRVDVSKKFDNDVRVVKATPEHLVGGMPPVPVPYYPGRGITLQPVRMLKHFVEKPKWSILGMLFQPYFLMMMLPMVMMFIMPKMMEGMDDEQKAEMKKNQAAMAGGGFDFAAMMASATTDKAAIKEKAKEAKKK